MGHLMKQRIFSRRGLRMVLAMAGVCLVGCIIVGPPLSWCLRKGSWRDEAPCSFCSCDCSSESALFFPFGVGIDNTSFKDCGKDDPEMKEEMRKDMVALLSEEINLQRMVINETLQHTRALTMDAKLASSHYQKEAAKCNAEMEICEEARERAEAELVQELKLSALWERRARELGWSSNRRGYT